MRIHRLRSMKDYLQYKEREAKELDAHRLALANLIPREQRSFTVGGYSYTADQPVSFQVTNRLFFPDGTIAWREDAACPVSLLNNRMRYSLHILDIEAEIYSNSKIYVTEQITPTFHYLQGKYPNTVGSEYFGDGMPYGSCNAQGIRNENLCRLTFPDKSFDVLVSNDVLEHIPDYMIALEECHRVLNDSGSLVFTIPIDTSCENSIKLAAITENGIEYFYPPAYHGDPLSDKGVLCFHSFGWDILESLRKTGFSDAYAVCSYSMKFGYLGGEQLVFVAKK